MAAAATKDNEMKRFLPVTVENLHFRYPDMKNRKISQLKNKLSKRTV